MGTLRKASIKETGEELSQEEWAAFDAAVAEEKRRRAQGEPYERDAAAREPGKAASRASRCASVTPHGEG